MNTNFKEVAAALKTIATCERDITERMKAAGIPAPYCGIRNSGMGFPMARLSSERRVFRDHQGRRNLTQTSCLLQRVFEEIEEVRTHLESKT